MEIENKLTVGRLRKILSDLPDEMPIVLADISNDDEDGAGVFLLSTNAVGVEELQRTDDYERTEKCFVLSFESEPEIS